MKRIVEIVPARPGWYARWRTSGDVTRSYPVTVWALVEDSTPDSREVIGVDSIGQWPGGDGAEEDAVFVRYLFHAPAEGRPDDAEPEPAPGPGSRPAGGVVPGPADGVVPDPVGGPASGPAGGVVPQEVEGVAELSRSPGR